MKILSLQTPVSENIDENIAVVAKYMGAGCDGTVDLVTLPEMFACPYETKLFPAYAEEEGGRIWQQCSALARKYRVYLSAGSIPERDGFCIYNTAYVFNRDGHCIGKHRKAHLFDIDVPGQYYKESETLSPGNQATVFDTEFGKMGLCICYDMRFPELFRAMVAKGAKLVIIPAAFNMTTGPAHWELLIRTRAVDNQVFTVATAPARNEKGKYVSWGHSMIAGPWGNVLMQMDAREGYAITEINLGDVSKVRDSMPLLRQRRTDIY